MASPTLSAELWPRPKGITAALIWRSQHGHVELGVDHHALQADVVLGVGVVLVVDDGTGLADALAAGRHAVEARALAGDERPLGDVLVGEKESVAPLAPECEGGAVRGLGLAAAHQAAVRAVVGALVDGGRAHAEAVAGALLLAPRLGATTTTSLA